ncbi:hypothetical protein [Agriterribacter sp.]|uniref:hypothetical protein n=1 Tax=Agriterribacter sp. TaxID=2821509 RepID=UPI002C6F0BB7|nr:hypothetical protein [Agriterribacter sp.]HRP57733.1 hypothetical protein [Agriterribacter sp.]
MSSALFTECASPTPTDDGIEEISVYLANNIDTNSLDLLRDFSYGANGDDNFWLRVSGDTNLYVCNFRFKGDTAKLSIWRPDKFTRDFSTAFNFDTAIYSQFTFSKLRGKIVKIEQDSSNGNSLIKDISATTEQFFPDKNPFTTFSELTSIPNRYSFVGSSYSSGMGDFFIFWLSPKFKLLYIPDTLKIDLKFKKYWLDEFNKGKKIKQHWSLINVSAK